MLVKIGVPHDFKRKPRSLEDMKFFKSKFLVLHIREMAYSDCKPSSYCLATKFHDLLLYFMLPIVRQFLTANYHCHFSLLVTAVYTLLSSSSMNDIKKSGVMLEYFVQKMETLYGIISY